MVEKTGKQTITLMPIIVNLDVMMAKRKVSLGELAERVDLTPANLSILKTGKAKAVRFSTLKSQSGALLHLRSHLQRTGLPARRHIGIPGGRIIPFYPPQRTQRRTEFLIFIYSVCLCALCGETSPAKKQVNIRLCR